MKKIAKIIIRTFQLVFVKFLLLYSLLIFLFYLLLIFLLISSHVGRIKQLIELDYLNTASIRLFILDEADKLLEEGSFQEQIK